jgi:FixJ family two-component response regulator
MQGLALSGQMLISVVDDDESMRAALMRLVRSLGYEARGFGSAEDFLDAAVARASSCIISDIQMPGMNGFDLKRHLAAEGIPTPVIMITARAEPQLKDRALASGAICFLRKPFEADTLIDCIERALHPTS